MEDNKARPLWMERWFQLLLGSLVLVAVASLVVPWVLGLIYALRSVLLPLVVALGLAYIFNPVVSWLQRRLKLPRWAGTGAVFIAGGWVVLILALLILPPLVSQGADLIQNARTYPDRISTILQQPDPGNSSESADEPQTDTKPEAVAAEPDQPVDNVADAAPDAPDEPPSNLADKSKAKLGQLRAMIDRALGPEQAKQMLASAAQWLGDLDWGRVAQVTKTSLDVGVGVVGSAISLTSYLTLSAVIALFCFFFFSWKLDKLFAWFVPFIPSQYRTEVLGVISQMDKSVAAFIRGRLIQALVMAIVLSIGWWLAGVPSWLLLGVLSGVLNLVPFMGVIGFLIALVLAVIDAAAGGSLSIWVFVWPTAVYLIAQTLDGWVVEPIVQGKATDLDPVSVLVAVMVGGALAGLLGMLIAIPTAACIKIVSREVVLPRLRKLAAGGEAEGVSD